jgi:hypothetical protein
VEKVRDEERERSTLWGDDLRGRFRMEKQVLEDKVASLEARLASATSERLPLTVQPLLCQ